MLHELLSQHRDDIVARCERKFRERHPDRASDELIDTLPAFLDELINAERRLAGLPELTILPEQSDYPRVHGKQRFRAGFAIAELPMDFGMISDAIGEVAIEQNVSLDARSYRILNEWLDKAIAAAISEYFTLSRESDEQGVAAWIGALGHELRNSVASAILAHAAIKEGHVGLQSRTARILERSLHRIESLVTHTLAAVQLKAGMPLHRDAINVRDLLDDIKDSLVDNEVSVTIDADPSLVIQADMRLVESALSNLVQNAIKFTRRGGKVCVRVQHDDTAVVMEVEDECGGLGAKKPDELFDAFVQGERKSAGVGLGLAITRQAIEAHGGRVTVRDAAPKGCVFSVVLPR